MMMSTKPEIKERESKVKINIVLDKETMNPQKAFMSSPLLSMTSFRAQVAETLNEIKGQMLHMMAKRMTASDAKILLKYWQAPYSPPVAEDKQTLSELNKVLNQSEVNSTRREIPENQHSIVSTSMFASDLHLLHPVFGELVADLGYKKVYLTSIRSLSHALVWEKQRILRPDRAANIAASKVAQGQSNSLSGVITMFLDAKSNKHGIIDGQHRVGALMLLSQQGYWDENARNVVVDVFTTTDEAQISALFREINSGEPVRLVDMPGEGMEINRKALLDDATDKLSSLYPQMFKTTTRCKPPHLNCDVIRDEIFAADLMNRLQIANSDDLLRYFLAVNDKFSKRNSSVWYRILDIDPDDNSKHKSALTALNKAKANNFFLGLDKSWLSSVIKF